MNNTHVRPSPITAAVIPRQYPTVIDSTQIQKPNFLGKEDGVYPIGGGRVTKIILSLLISIFINHSSFADGITPEVTQLKRPLPTSVLFVGNSYLYYNDSLHNHFKRMVDEKYPGYEGSKNVKSSTIGGSRLKHHNLDHLLRPKAISSINKFELVILQGGSGEGLSKKDRKAFADMAKEHIGKITANGSQAALYMIHAYVEPHENFDSNLIRVIEKMYVAAGNTNQTLVIPVGLAFENAYKRRPDIKLHNLDGTHPALLGTYLAACTVFASVFNESPVGLSYDYNGLVSTRDKLFLQEIAESTVRNFYHSS